MSASRLTLKSDYIRIPQQRPISANWQAWPDNVNRYVPPGKAVRAFTRRAAHGAPRASVRPSEIRYWCVENSRRSDSPASPAPGTIAQTRWRRVEERLKTVAGLFCSRGRHSIQVRRERTNDEVDLQAVLGQPAEGRINCRAIAEISLVLSSEHPTGLQSAWIARGSCLQSVSISI